MDVQAGLTRFSWQKLMTFSSIKFRETVHSFNMCRNNEITYATSINFKSDPSSRLYNLTSGYLIGTLKESYGEVIAIVLSLGECHVN
jgi:hypothetical protein